MTDPYTPTTEEVREYVEEGGWFPSWLDTGENESDDEARLNAFDRWLADHTASALEDAANRLVHHIPAGEQLRDRAEEIRKGARG